MHFPWLMLFNLYIQTENLLWNVITAQGEGKPGGIWEIKDQSTCLSGTYAYDTLINQMPGIKWLNKKRAWIISKKRGTYKWQELNDCLPLNESPWIIVCICLPFYITIPFRRSCKSQWTITSIVDARSHLLLTASCNWGNEQQMRPGNKDLQKQPHNSGSLVHMCNFDAFTSSRVRWSWRWSYWLRSIQKVVM